jgi:hypothetical protein
MLRDPETKWIAIAALAAIAVGTVAYTFLEHWTPIQALYFSVVTLATVGYGDLHPTSEVSELFTVAYIFLGLGILAAFAIELTKYREAGMRERSLDLQRDLERLRERRDHAAAPESEEGR